MAPCADSTIRQCYCAPGVLLGLSLDQMGTCRVACEGADHISCGGINTPIVYTTNAGLGIFPELVDRLALPLPVYECSPTCKLVSGAR